MQLGTRWAAGSAAPSRLPAVVAATVASIEADLPEQDRANWRWTLTWLEGRPIVEADSGIRVLYDPAEDRAVVEED
jgi:hypothetical protein